MNAEAAVSADKLAETRRQKTLTCFAHVVEPRLCALLQGRSFGEASAGRLRLEFFNVYEQGARLMLEEKPPQAGSGDTLPHVLVVGGGRMGGSLVTAAARQWYEQNKSSGRRMRITLVDRNAQAKAELLRQQFPKLERACELVPVQAEISSAEFLLGGFVLKSPAGSSISSAYVCLGSDSLGLSAGLLLLEVMRERRVPVLVRTVENAGLAVLVGDAGKSICDFDCLTVFPLYERTCTADVVLTGFYETLGRAYHEDYLLKARARGETPQTNPRLVPWQELTEEFQESNRNLGQFAAARLKAINCTIVPLTDWDAAEFKFTPAEIERLARMEHDRYVEEKTRAGWKYAPGPKDDKARTNPTLVPWEQLPQVEKQKDVDVVCETPAILARVGLEIRRLEAP
jgi:hypothetical protein